MTIEVENLVIRYGALTVVHGISFRVAKGEFVSLLGPSGCGKTSTLRCLAGLEAAGGGSVVLGGRTVADPARSVIVPPHQRNVGMVFQSYAIWPHMTVQENVAFPLKLRGVAAAEQARQVSKVLAAVELGHLKERYPSQLSGGQQQRIALARAIVGSPDVLFFDEPLSNLDTKLRETTRVEIKRLQKRLDVAAIYVTHDQDEALSMSDRVIVMNRGRIMQEGKPEEIYRTPANRFVAEFVGRANFIEVVSAGDGNWRMPGGGAMNFAKISPVGTKSDLMVRPEAISIAAPGSAAVEGDMVQLQGTIVSRNFLGPTTEYEVRVGNDVMLLKANIEMASGTDVSIVFDAKDGQIISRE